LGASEAARRKKKTENKDQNAPNFQLKNQLNITAITKRMSTTPTMKISER
jgi:hypothetical protein